MKKKLENKEISLTNEEYSHLFSGAAPMKTYDLSSKGIRPLTFSDGPVGVRMEDANGDSLAGISKTLPSTCFPAGSSLASSFDDELMSKVGQAIGEEASYYGADIVLAPAINIMRNPLGGRNFEYYSEDPFLAGELATNYVKGMQSVGVGACLKHFAANNNEKNRFVGDSIIDSRALHDIYLKPFEMVVKNAHPYAVMSAYNKINGTFCSQNEYLLNDTLREQWGFKGIVMTDWGGTVSRPLGLINGCDIEMPGMVTHNINLTKKGLDDKSIPHNVAISSASRIQDVANLTSHETKQKPNFKEHASLAYRGAIEGAVLLKNDGTLPLSEDKDICIIGSLYETPRYQGSGSSMLNPLHFVSHKQALASRNLQYEYSEGYDQFTNAINKKKEEKAIELANKHSLILFYGGLTDFMESEGFDRDNMKLPLNQVSLLTKLIALNKKIIFVYFGGNAVEMPFIKDINALLDMGLPGEMVGEATHDLLFGYVSPSGRLTYSWPVSYNDVPFGEEFTKSKQELYKESIYVGYRYYASLPHKVLFPFGYGLSYSSFSYSEMEVKTTPSSLLLSIKVTNTGLVLASNIVEAYVGLKNKDIPSPLRELKGYSRLSLNPGETKKAEIVIPFSRLVTYDVINNKEAFIKTHYMVEIASDSLSPIASKEIELGEDTLSLPYLDEVRKKIQNPELLTSLTDEEFETILGRKIVKDEHTSRPYDYETAIRDYKTPFGRFFSWVTGYVGLRQYKKGRRLKDPAKREREMKAGWFVYKLMGNNSLRSLCFSSSGSFKYNVATGILYMVNGHFIKGIRAMSTKEK